MAQHQVDAEDAVVFVLFGLAAGASVGIANVELWGYTFTDVITAIAGYDITIASLVSAATFGWVVYTNQVGMDEIRELDDVYYYAVLATGALILGIAFVPTVHTWVTSSDLIALGALLVQSAGLIAVSYMA